jgi:hypothetical protein
MGSLRDAVDAFLRYSDQQPRRGSRGVGGMTIEANMKAEVVLISAWELELLREAMAEDTP